METPQKLRRENMETPQKIDPHTEKMEQLESQVGVGVHALTIDMIYLGRW